MPMTRSRTFSGTAAALVLTVSATIGPLSVVHHATRGNSVPRDGWGNGQAMPWLIHLNTDNSAEAVGISCRASGSCAAIGFFEATTVKGTLGRNGFVVSESKGKWQRVVSTEAVSPVGVSCGAPGNCVVAAGDVLGDVYIAELGGVWQSPRKLPSVSALQGGITSISCSAADNCSAVGAFQIESNGEDFGYQNFVVSETDGTWGNAVEIPGLEALAPYAGGGVGDPQISCASNGNCSVAGCYSPTFGIYGWPTDCHPYVDDEVDDTWEPALALPDFTKLGVSGDIDSISCASTGNCGAVGSYAPAAGDDQDFVVNEVGGTWEPPIPVPGLPQSTRSGDPSGSISCSAANDCEATGSYLGADVGGTNDFVVSEVGGTWGDATGSPVGNQVSCASPGNCVDIGFKYVVDQVNGIWQRADAIRVAGSSGPLDYPTSVSCAPSGYCGIAGVYTDKSGRTEASVAMGRSGDPTCG